ncbi:hypothetical protein [Micromonospora sp. DT47]|uniref:hypothetical protein n=1 Tax=Micromonospora sp. DT47 TaxID=3393431 RepID=UPI003CF6B2B4
MPTLNATEPQPKLPQRGPGEWAQQGGQQGPVGGLESDALVAELALQHGDLVAQDEDLGVLVVIAAGSSRSSANTLATPR